MKGNILETVVGFAVILLAIGFLLFVYKINNNQNTNIENSYKLRATFQNIEGINVGSDVLIAGVKVGQVLTLDLDPQNFDANIVLSVSKTIKLPSDSQAAVVTSGLLGGKYIALTPGGEEITLKENEKIQYTQSTINIESLINKFMYYMGNKSQ